MTRNKIFTFVGASGVGKSTCMNYLKNNYNIDCVELSARPFLKNNGESYDIQMTDSIQNNIQFNNTTTLLKTIIKNERGKLPRSICYSRSMLDPISYALALNKGLDCWKQQIQLIKEMKNEFIYLYIPIEFEMSDVLDKKRGTNEEVRNKTNEHIVYYLKNLDILYYTICGSIKEREKILDKIMYIYNIDKK